MKDAAIGHALTDGLLDVSEALLLSSTNPWELDAAMRAGGFVQGVCEAQDIRGLDGDLARRMSSQTCDMRTAMPISTRMVAEGRLGRKVGVGWFRYPGGGGLVIDPLVEDLLREEARFAGITRYEQSDQNLSDHVMVAIIRAALQILHLAGQSARARIDRISLQATGFSIAHGGALGRAVAVGPVDLVPRLKALPTPDLTADATRAGFDVLFG